MGSKRSFLLTVLILVAAVFVCQGITVADPAETGTILGYVFEADGTTPVEGAVIRVVNTLTGTELESTTSDQRGTFQIAGIERGIYQYAVSTPRGVFAANSEFGVNLKGTDTAKMAINLADYEADSDIDIADMPAAEAIAGETFIGRIIWVDPESNVAEILVMQGALETNDKVHALGETTDFYEKIKNMEVGEFVEPAAVPGETAFVEFSNPVQIGDAIYVAAAGAPLAFLLPLVGVAAVGAGTAGVYEDPRNIQTKNYFEERIQAVSPFGVYEKDSKKAGILYKKKPKGRR